MQIGQVADQTGVSAKMIRHYETIGLIGGARRANGYRDYSARDAHELRFIRSARDLGFSLDEIRALLDLWRDRARRSGDVHQLAARHLADVERRIADLKRMAASLKSLIGACHGDARPDCPILEGLAQPAAAGDKI